MGRIVRRTASGASTAAAVCVVFEVMTQSLEDSPKSLLDFKIPPREVLGGYALLAGIGAAVGLVSSLLELTFSAITGVFFKKD